MKNDPRQLSLWNEAIVEIYQSREAKQMHCVQKINNKAPKKHKWMMNVKRLYKFVLPVAKQVWLISLVFMAIKWLHLPPEVLTFIIH